jgi:AcrR family transcriptional regulator
VTGTRRELSQVGLRELKKRRTRETIVRVALDLFTERGFQATTLVDIAGAADIAPSTLHAYFPSKDDIVFSNFSETLETAKRRVLDRPRSESTIEALEDWIATELPNRADPDSEAVRRRRAIIDTDEGLLIEERVRLALLEDILAAAFAIDLEEDANDLRARLMGAIAVSGLRAIWVWWFDHRLNADSDPREPYTLDATYLTRVLDAAESVLEDIPRRSSES